MPTHNDRPQHPPANHKTWFLEHFSVGLIPPVLPFYTSVCAKYGLALNHLHPNYIRYMTRFYLVCMWMGVGPTARRFQSCFLIRNINPFNFYLSARSKEKKATFLAHVPAWENFYIFVEKPVDQPFNFLPWAENLPIQVDLSTLNLDSQTSKLNEIFYEGSFNLEQMCSHEPLLAFWGTHPDPLLARDLDLGEFLFICS